MKDISAILFLCVVLTASSINSAALSALDKYDILINDDNSASDMFQPRVAAGQGGGFVVVWVDNRNGRSEIYCQFLDSTGIAQGINRRVNEDISTAPRFEPAVAGNQFGQWAAVWKDYRNGTYPFRPDIYYGKIDTLVPVANLNITSEPPDSGCESPDLAVFPNGSGVVVWSDYRNRNWDIYGQRLGVNGELTGKNFKINTDAGIYQQHSPRVAAFADGGFVIVWYDNRFGNDDVYAQRFDPLFNPIGANQKISDDPGTARQAFPVTAADGRGRFFVAWVDWRNGSYPQNPDIFFRRFDSLGVPLGPSARANLDDNGRSQKEVALASDWSGNICLAWADSSAGQWDAYAQILDEAGLPSGASFKIHQTTAGRQLQPDLAADGYKLFFVWADSRSGNFDIYATIKQYNRPGLISTPTALNFTMEAGGALPASSNLVLSGAGLGQVHWTAAPTVGWLAVAPSSGLTPDTLAVSIGDGSLPYGRYSGFIRLIDIDHADSATVLPVTLTVTAPILKIVPDTLSFRVFAAIGNPSPQKCQLINDGTGALTWSAIETASWFNLDKTSGVDSEYFSVSIDITGLAYGRFFEPIVVSSPEAVNVQETCWVSLELIGNMPYMAVRPESLNFQGWRGETLLDTVEIIDLGSGVLNWEARPSEGWMSLDKYRGSGDGLVIVELSTASLTKENYLADITFSDSASFNQVIHIPLSVQLKTADTLQFINANVLPEGTGIMPVQLRLNQSCKGGYIPITFDPAMISIDSIVPNYKALPEFVSWSTSSGDSGLAELFFNMIDSLAGGSSIQPGSYIICNLFLAAGAVSGLTRVDSGASDSALYLLNAAGQRIIPRVIPGEVVIGCQSSVGETTADELPERVVLGQNYPNPFNTVTSFEAQLPRRGKVLVSVFNLLGQEVYRLLDGLLPAGRTRIIWDGNLFGGKAAPSGIYFYRLTAGETVQVRKMVLLK